MRTFEKPSPAGVIETKASMTKVKAAIFPSQEFFIAQNLFWESGGRQIFSGARRAVPKLFMSHSKKRPCNSASENDPNWHPEGPRAILAGSDGSNLDDLDGA